MKKKYNLDQWWNNDKCRCDCKKIHSYEKDYVQNPATYNCENGKCLASIMDDSAIICNEVIESYNEEINLNEKKQSVKQNVLIFYLHFH